MTTGTCQVIHISDFHVKAKEAGFWSPDRAQKIASSALRDGPYSLVLVIASGDIAYSGAVEEYEIAKVFFGALLEEAAQRASSDVKLILCPGNHDCDFSVASKLRSYARSQALDATVADDEMVSKLASPLANFKNFETHLETFPFSERTVVQKSGVVEEGGFRIQVRVFTSPLFSDIRETKGELFLPPAAFETGWDESTFRVGVMHHPPAWFTQESGRPIRTALRGNAHIVLYGHEHEPELSKVATPATASRSEAIEVDGGVLHDHGDSAHSTFITLTLSRQFGVLARKHEWAADQSCFAQKPISELDREGGWIEAPRKVSALSISPHFLDKLKDPGIALSSNATREISAKSLYVFPTVSETKKGQAQIEEVLSSAVLLQPENLRGGVVVQGEEKAGKTSLLLRLFESYHEAGYAPIYVPLREHKIKAPGDLKKVFLNSSLAIYPQQNADSLAALQKAHRVFFVDDVDVLTKPELRAELVALVRAQCDLFLFTTTLRPQLTEVLTADSTSAVGGIRQLRISRMTAVMRGALISRWVDVVERIDDEAQLIARIDHLEKSAAVTLGHNLVPRVPQMLLIFLQSSSAASQSKLESGALAQYYNFLVTQHLLGAGIKPDELDEPNTFAREVAYHMHVSGLSYITISGLEECNRKFSEEFIPGPMQGRLNVLRNARLLTEVGSDAYEWRQPYFQHLFLGAYLGRNMSDSAVRAVVKEMLQHLYVRSNANALLFLTHYSRDQDVFEELTQVISGLFRSSEPLRLGEDTRAFAEIIKNVEGLTVPEGGAVKARERRNLNRDQLETVGGDGLTNDKKEVAAITTLEEIIVLFKTSEIVGQVLKEQYASIRRSTREPLVVALLEAYRRAAGGILTKLMNSSELLTAWIKAQAGDVEEKSPEEIMQISQTFLSQLIQMLMFAFFQKLADSISSEKTLDLVNHIKWEDRPEPKVLLFACELNIQKPLPLGQLDALLKIAGNDPAFIALLRNLVQMRISMFHTRAVDLQTVASRFGVQVKRLNVIEFNEAQKR